jgi:hypothetical protein
VRDAILAAAEKNSGLPARREPAAAGDPPTGGIGSRDDSGRLPVGSPVDGDVVRPNERCEVPAVDRDAVRPGERSAVPAVDRDAVRPGERSAVPVADPRPTGRSEVRRHA